MLAETLAAAVILSGIALRDQWLFVGGVVLLIVVFLWRRWTIVRGTRKAHAPQLTRASINPLICPNADHSWENEATFNPAAVVADGRIHLFYRALGADGISRIGYASSMDGIHFDDRLPYPVFTPELAMSAHDHAPHTSPARLAYDRSLYTSGGGWGGSEDPRAVVIDDHIHMTFSSFNGWDSICITHTSLHLDHLRNKHWHWSRPALLSPHKGKNKNWVIFPEKIRGMYAILHGISPKLFIEYVERIEDVLEKRRHAGAGDHGGNGYQDPSRKEHWDNMVRGAGAPPLRTDHGWLLFYQALSPHDRSKYNVGVMLLDLQDPSHILYRSSLPILTPDMPYENDWKPGIVYASGAVVKDGTLFVYYGGGDKTVNVAYAPLQRFMSELMLKEHRV